MLRTVRRHRWLAVAGAAALAVVPACGGGGDSVGSDGDDAPAAVQIVTTTVPVPATAADIPTTTSPAVDPVALIGAAIDGLAASGYHFTTTITVDGAEVLVADGDRVGDGTRLTVSRAGGATVDYVVTPAGSWVRPSGGDWELVDGPTGTATDPVAALRAPTAAGVTGTGTGPDGPVTEIVATVPASALGVAADGTAQVQIRIEGTSLREVGYATSIDGRTAIVRAVIGPVADATPVVAPI